MNRHTAAGDASVSLMCATFGLSRAAFYAEARRQRGDAPPPSKPAKGDVIPLPRRPRYTAAEVVLERIRDVLTRDTARAWGVRKVWATLKREGLKVSRRRVHALKRANGLVLVRDSEPGEPARGHVAVPEPKRRIRTRALHRPRGPAPDGVHTAAILGATSAALKVARKLARNCRYRRRFLAS